MQMICRAVSCQIKFDSARPFSSKFITNMIQISLKSPENEKEFQHGHGPLEFGRGPRRDLPRQTVNDPYMSFNQLVVEELGDQQLRVDNVSEHVPVEIDGSEPLGILSSRIVKLPVHLRIGKTDLHFSTFSSPIELDETTRTLKQMSFSSENVRSLRELGSAPDPETLARWFETLICVQQAAASSSEFFFETAQAVVNLVGLDRGLVLLREANDWKAVAEYAAEPFAATPISFDQEPEYSHRVLNEVLQTGQTFYQTMGSAPPTAS